MQVLVVEGGGMKAAYANGVLSGFEEAGYRPFDAVVGTSAGGALAAWYSAGQAAYAEGTWKYAADPRILNYRRFLTRQGPLLDHEALLDIVYQEEHPLDVEAVKRAEWPVQVSVVDITTGACEYPDIRQGDVIAWLKATGRLPFASGPPVTIDGRTFLDGGVLDPVPVRYAVERLGADHVTLISNNPPGPKRKDPKPMLMLASRRYPHLKDGIHEHHAIKEASMAYAENPPSGVQIDVLRPGAPTGLGRLTRDLDLIQDGIALGREHAAEYLRDA